MITLHERTLELTKNRRPSDGRELLELGHNIGNLCWVITRNQRIDISIGDCLITCTVIADSIGKNLVDKIKPRDETDYTIPLQAIPLLVHWLGELQGKGVKEIYLNNIVSQLENIAIAEDTSLKKCWSLALDVRFREFKKEKQMIVLDEKTLHERTLELTKSRKPSECKELLDLGYKVGTLCWAIARGTVTEKLLGDCLISCTVIANIDGKSLMDIVETRFPSKNSYPAVSALVYWLGECQGRGIKDNSLCNIYYQLGKIAKENDTNLAECWYLALVDYKRYCSYME